ncbi:MAG: hypothetical protein GWO41_07365 [candidate division Zixibacteria bacterium]|nr:hypothetical protein [candidate division Zixibacteria bacterium]NIR67576.1 hypothetical protein [candidate division Zixibacteria bacterium]NIS16143.1 hypothetical protein [candidate division Zixibacteria bacterium]NIS48837.1 hypothetical protein [candidate division Zixibacteria bacterium]NIT52546.1 hypothetical protein [candidate division Zixibacteria bacterium]
MKKLALTAAFCLAIAVLFVSLACEGDVGPQGPEGPPGEPGEDAMLTPPSDRVFALAIFNGTARDHNGINAATLTFDTTATPSSSIVVGNKIDQAPVIDGIFEGSEVWGENASSLELEHQAFADNFIYNVTMIASYDDHNVYFLLQWDEVSQGDYVVGVDDRHLDWSYDDLDEEFVVNLLYEDRVALMFQDSRSLIGEWRLYGCLTGCHPGEGLPDNMQSASPSIVIDTWQWGAMRSENLEIGLDRALSSSGFVQDGGIPPIRQNLEVIQRIVGDEVVDDTVPIYMHMKQLNDPEYMPDDILWEYLAVPFTDTLSWTVNSYISGWFAMPPSTGNDVLKSAGQFSDGTWTVEFSRPRITEDPYDAQF